MKLFTKLTLVLVIFIFTRNTGHAQVVYKYKIVFKSAVADQPDEAKLFLQKHSSTNLINGFNVDEAIITSLKQINMNVLSGKLEKLKAPVKSIDLLCIEANTPATEKRVTTPVSEMEIQDKAAKSQQQQIEMKDKQVFAEPNRRY